jgi:hypothetical protein
MKFSVEQKLFIHSIIVQNCIRRKCRRKFRKKYPDNTVPHRARIYNTITKLYSTGCVLDKNKFLERHVLTKQNLDENVTRLEARPKKSLGVLALQYGLANSTAHIGTKLLKLLPCKSPLLHIFLPP